MSVADRDADHWTGEVELDKLELASDDVREDRPQHKIKELGMDFEQRGQLQAALCYVDPDDVDLDGRDPAECELDWLVAQTDVVYVTDGWSRKLAAEAIGWPTLRCEVFREPPADEVMSSLAANMKRIEMRDYEIVSKIHEHHQQSDLTQADVADAIGYSEATVSKMFTALDGFEPAVEAWASPDSHVEMNHVLAVERCEFDEDKERVFRNCVAHERSVSQTREDAQRASKETAAEKDDGRNLREKQADGAAEKAEAEVKKAREDMAEEETCDLCGGEANTKVVLDVCPEDRGLVIQAKESGEPLAQPADEQGGRPPDKGGMSDRGNGP